ncbi:type III polyketide synthase [Streptomyces sp. TR1341]|uniref:3,5-dihydroxyphenylacetyl-CoA synthase DpgA n=1 Tax=Streptomyces TaxID=1883 RepID=UPI00138AB853|nr:3,5-dihydroxyphenylacetyl-CoA synthase DpgA [Streptomyces murinus]NDK29595.1 type III polyketide synthase [Streptomyces sp. TR1341]
MITHAPDAAPGLVGVATANPATSYTQQDILDLYRIDDERVTSLFLNGHIDRRYLHVPAPGPDGVPVFESQGELLAKHRADGVELATQALVAFLKESGAGLDDVRYLCCVTSTGAMTPGFSARLIKELGLRVDCTRLDVVGMGCNAGLNGLNATTSWAAANPGKLAVMVCVEVCSAAYVFDGTMRTAVVNGLFGDGAAAVGVLAGAETRAAGPRVLKFSSRIIPEAVEAMRYDWDDVQGKFSFFIDRDVPYVVGAHAEEAIDTLLDGTGLRRSDIDHWIVHSGGKKVIDAVKVNLGLEAHDLRHTTSVLRDFGNLSSGSFLFSYERLTREELAQPGDHAVFMTMGPGSTIETALLRWP